MKTVYAVVSYNSETDQDVSVVGWSVDREQATKLESQMNDTAEHLFGDESLVSYYTIVMPFLGAATEYEPYGPFDGIICRDKIVAITPEGQAEHYGYLNENVYPISGLNLLKGLDSYLS